MKTKYSNLAIFTIIFLTSGDRSIQNNFIFKFSKFGKLLAVKQKAVFNLLQWLPYECSETLNSNMYDIDHLP
jgi:hypothetical protein